MHGLVSLLPEPLYGHVLTIWDELERRFGLRGIRVTPYPHFSWQIGDDYPSPALEDAMREVAAEEDPLEVKTAGLGLFAGPKPALFVAVVRSPALSRLHARIWDRLATVGLGISPHYSPENWMPHISLAYMDLTPDNLGPVLAALSFRDFHWQMRIDNIAFIHEPSGEIGDLRWRMALGDGRGARSEA